MCSVISIGIIIVLCIVFLFCTKISNYTSYTDHIDCLLNDLLLFCSLFGIDNSKVPLIIVVKSHKQVDNKHTDTQNNYVNSSLSCWGV